MVVDGHQSPLRGVDSRTRHLTDEPLLDARQTRLFQLGQVAREIAFGQAGQALQEEEVNLGRAVECG